MGLFSSLNVGYRGLQVNQNAVDVTNNNITNASNPNYTRQRVEITPSIVVHTSSGEIGTGAEVHTIVRIKNEFLFNRYIDANKNLSYAKTLQENLKEIVSYFPDVKDAGLNKDIQNYFDAWSNFADNPNDENAKVDLASKTQILADTIRETREKIENLNSHINERIKTNIDEVNNLIKDIAGYTKEIRKIEADHKTFANALRDKRDKAEKRLVELTGARVIKYSLKSRSTKDGKSLDYETNYSIVLGNYTIIDNETYHKLKIEPAPESNKNINSIYFERQDHKKIDITKDIPKKSVIGALLQIRGTSYDKHGNTNDGISRKYINLLDSLSATIIQQTNSIYAYSAQEKATGDRIFDPVSLVDKQANTYPLSSEMVKESLHNPVREGELTLSAYDNNGKFQKDIEVKIDPNKSLQDNLDNINNALANADVDYEAVVENGNVAFKKKDNDGNGSLDNGALLVKDDGSGLFSALNDIQFKNIEKTNNENLKLPIKDGKFDVVVYKDNGDELARRTIVVNSKSKDPLYSTLAGIVSQINIPNIDDNNDNNSSNDIDDYYKATIANGKIVLNKKSDENVYIGLDNDDAMFGGAVGINKFFDGDDSATISLNKKFIENPSLIHAYKAPSDGNNDVANDMLQLQYKKIEITSKNGDSVNTTIPGYYRYLTGKIANDANEVNTMVDSQKTIFNSIEKEYQGESGVNLDEELTNLMKFQHGYQASAKVITTISKMLDTLMGIKR